MRSVALCTYNGEHYIRQQLDSILRQTMKVDEIVVCDDGSTDQTLSILKNVADGSAINIHIHRNATHLGPAYNFQQAISLCRGDLIFLCDQDDVWHEEKVAVTQDYFDHHPDITVVFTNAYLIGGDGRPLEGTLWDYCFDKEVRALFDAGLEFECFAYGNHATGATMAIRRQTIPDINYNPDFLHDHALAALAANNDSLGYIDQCLISYRIHENQVCGIMEVPPVTWSDLASAMKEVAALPLRADKWERLAFNKERRAFRKQLLGPLKILMHQKQYKKLYRKASRTMLGVDLRESFRHKIRILNRRKTT